MSFYTDSRAGIFPGLTNNITNGLCERICIQATKVFDACLNQVQIDNYILTLSDFTPANPTFPLTFISAYSSATQPATVTNLIITRFEDRPNFSRVQATVNIPVVVTYTDANGVSGTANATVSIDEDVVLYVPQPALTPINVVAFGSAVSTIGTFTADNNFSVTICVTVVLKVVAEVDVLIPSYGYCPIPPCTPFTADEICPGVFETPLYPTAVAPQTRENNNNN
ncbi:MAG: hypothetical protein IJX26_02585 [Clostridia bacterium]|nr:hypothetical protein [Clostridia bacterium]